MSNIQVLSLVPGPWSLVPGAYLLPIAYCQLSIIENGNTFVSSQFLNYIYISK